MVLKDLDINNANDIQFFEDLYIKSFPLSERRPLAYMYMLSKDNPYFTIQVAVHGGKTVGFFCFWEIEDFIFAEYFAIDSALRNGGYGRKVIEKFVSNITKPVILEVELPSTIIAERRIGFYQRLGFTLWENVQYQQPAYVEGGLPIPMKLMSMGDINIEKDIKEIRSTLYAAVYNC